MSKSFMKYGFIDRVKDWLKGICIIASGLAVMALTVFLCFLPLIGGTIVVVLVLRAMGVLH